MGLPLLSIIPIATNLIEKALEFFDVDDKRQAEFVLQEIKNSHELAQGQLEINKEEAKSESLFVAGWRPAIGWVCAFGLFNNYILIPYARFFISIYYPEFKLDELPILSEELLALVFALLGLGTFRTVEKIKSKKGA